MKTIKIKKLAIVFAAHQFVLNKKPKVSKFNDKKHKRRLFYSYLFCKNDQAWKDAIGMSKNCFFSLVNEIKATITNNIKTSKQLPFNLRLFIGLQWLTKSFSIRDQFSFWKMSYGSIKNCRYTTLQALMNIYSQFVNWNIIDNQRSIKIDNHNQNKIFEKVIGAIDGTHIQLILPEEEKEAHRNYHTFISTNLLVVCNFEMNFMYALAGFEGIIIIFIK